MRLVEAWREDAYSPSGELQAYGQGSCTGFSQGKEGAGSKIGGKKMTDEEPKLLKKVDGRTIDRSKMVPIFFQKRRNRQGHC